MNVLVTGCAGFIGFHVCKRLMSEGHTVVGIDNLNPYLNLKVKNIRLNELLTEGLTFNQADINDVYALDRLFRENSFDLVIHLAALAGVRNSVENPIDYIQTNIVGFSNIIDFCRSFGVERFVFASSSSVYGDSVKAMSEGDYTDSPESVYAATKKTDELIAYSYSQLYKLKVTGLRFFTVYGEYGRSDMCYWKFTEDFLTNRKVMFNNYGDIYRDFTYIGDLVERISQIVNNNNTPLYKIYNIGSGNPVRITMFANELFEQMRELGMIDREFINFGLAPMQAGDVFKTHADLSELEKDYGCKPVTPLREGLAKFLNWYKLYIIEK